MRFLLASVRPFKKAAAGDFHNFSHVGLIRPVMNHHQIIVTAFRFLQKALQKIALVKDANN
jgi:hypothetical protein